LALNGTAWIPGQRKKGQFFYAARLPAPISGSMQQDPEVAVAVLALNRMSELGRPISVRIK
jgi:hypothetical protein